MTFDQSKCEGNGCPLKEGCLRYTSKSEVLQSWFLVEPYNREKMTCELYKSKMNDFTDKPPNCS